MDSIVELSSNISLKTSVSTPVIAVSASASWKMIHPSPRSPLQDVPLKLPHILTLPPRFIASNRARFKEVRSVVTVDRDLLLSIHAVNDMIPAAAILPTRATTRSVSTREYPRCCLDGTPLFVSAFDLLASLRILSVASTMYGSSMKQLTDRTHLYINCVHYDFENFRAWFTQYTFEEALYFFTNSIWLYSLRFSRRLC